MVNMFKTTHDLQGQPMAMERKELRVGETDEAHDGDRPEESF